MPGGPPRRGPPRPWARARSRGSAIERHRGLGARRRELHALLRLAEIQLEVGGLDEADEAIEEALKAAVDVADARLEAALRGTRSRVRVDQGRPAEARTLAEQAARAFTALGDRLHEGIATLYVAQAAHAAGDPSTATYAAAADGVRGTALEVPALAGWCLVGGSDAVLARLEAAAGPGDAWVVATCRAVREGRPVPPSERPSREERLLARLARR